MTRHGQHQDTGAEPVATSEVAADEADRGPAVSTDTTHATGILSDGGFWLLTPVAFLRRAAAPASDWFFGPPGPHDWRI